MTRAEWRACDSPMLMLQHLQGRASDRKPRLFGITWERVREIAEIVLHGQEQPQA